MSDTNNTPTTTTETEVNVEVTDNTKKKKLDTTTLIAIIALVCFIIAVVVVGIFFFKNKKLRDDVYTEQTRVVSLTKNVEDLEKEISQMNTENVELDNSLEKAFKGMAARDIVIEQLNNENETLKKIKQEVMEIQKITASLKTSNDQLKQIQDRVQKIIDTKQWENNELKKKIN